MDTIILKDDYSFLISDRLGEIEIGSQNGLYYRDTRYLSGLKLLVNDQAVSLLSYNYDYNIGATFHLSSQQGHSPRGIGLIRRRFVQQGLVESLEFTNYHYEPVTISVQLKLAADFADIFEVRGYQSDFHGQASELSVLDSGRLINFWSVASTHGRQPHLLRFECNQIAKHELSETTFNSQLVPEITLRYNLVLPPHQPLTLHFSLLVEPSSNTVEPKPNPIFAVEVAKSRQAFRDWQTSCTGLVTSNAALAKMYETSVFDLRSLIQPNLGLTAGLPWYFTLFGRDSLIAAIQTLTLNPLIAVETLRALARYQATDFDDERDAEPGKILHEIRFGDMTVKGQMPYNPYYGSVDSTPLFLICFARTLAWWPEASLFTELWPNVERALEWCDKHANLTGDGYLRYKRRSKKGLIQQGWKDSNESLGNIAEQPIALVEVQGYYYAGLMGIAKILRRYNHQLELADKLELKAANLQKQFNRDFWWEAEGFLAQALDANNAQIRRITSNVGHCLWSGIVEPSKAARIVERLVQPDMLSGWGLRTLSANDPTYNPMSYHNGSIWPHDNALAVAGLRQYGFELEALLIASQILEAAISFPDFRLPELYCGFARNQAGLEEKAPAAYPVSCSPQAWAAGTIIMLIQTLLGLEADPSGLNLTIAPILLEGVQDLTLQRLQIGQQQLELVFGRDADTGRIRLLGSNSTGISIKDKPT